MSSGGGGGGGKPRPIHYPPHKVNEKPSDQEPAKSYEKTSQYLDDDYYISVSEQFHRELGDLCLMEPPRSATAAAAARGVANSSAVAGNDTSPTSRGTPGRRAAPQDSSSGKQKAEGGIRMLPANIKPGGGSLQRNISSFDDANSLNAAGCNRSDNIAEDALSRSPGSCPSFTSVARAKQGDRGESLTSAVSTLAEDEQFVGGGHDSYDAGFLNKWPSEAPIKPPAKGKKKAKSSGSNSSLERIIVEDSAPLSPRYTKASSSAKKIGSAKANDKGRSKAKAIEARRHAKYHAKTRARMRDIRQDALSGSAEFGHDSLVSALNDDEVNALAGRTVSQLSVEENKGGTLRGRRAERLDHEINKASVTKRLLLRDLNLTARELPVTSICSFPLGSELTKLSLAGNHLNRLPDQLVHSLQGLRTLDLQQCGLVSLPNDWDLPNLRRLNLSHNHLKTFLSANAIRGLPRLIHLTMSNNSIYDFSLPDGPILENLEYLSLVFNDISHLPEGMPRLAKLKVLRLCNNYITHVPQAVCRMPLSELEVTPNPLIQPPLGDCEQGIGAMRRYYAGLERRERRRSRLEDESTPSPQPRRIKTSAWARRARRANDMSFLEALEVGAPSPQVDTQKRFNSTSAILPAMNLRDGGSMLLPQVATVPLQAGASPLHPAMPPLTAIALTEPRRAWHAPEARPETTPDVTNDTLKLVFVGMSRSGKTTIMNRLKQGMLARIPKKEESTIGISIDSWDPKKDCEKYSIDASSLNTAIVQEDAPTSVADADVRFSLWDFAGQEVYHATHSIFFSPSALYVLVWDMGWNNKATRKVEEPADELEDGPFQWLDSDDEGDNEMAERAARIADKALDDDIDDKVQYWIDCVRASVPGAVILPVATHDDCFDEIGGADEARRRCRIMKERILRKEQRRVDSLRRRLAKLEKEHRANSPAATRIRELISPYRLPKLIFEDDNHADAIIRVSGKCDTGFGALREKILNLATGRDTAGMDYPLFRGHVGSIIPPFRLKVRDLVREKRLTFQVLEWSHFSSMVEKHMGKADDADLNDALRFLSRIGEISFFGEVEGLEERPHIASTRFHDAIFYDTSDDEDDEEDDDGYTPAPLQDGDAANNLSEPSPLATQVKLSGLSQFIFINPLWLAVTLRCVLRHDLKQQLDTVRSKSDTSSSRWANFGRADSFHNAALRCPVLRSSDARLLWESNAKIAKSARRAIQDDADSSEKCAFQYMERLLVYFGVFVPISLNACPVLLDGETYSRSMQQQDSTSTFFFLPSQLQPWEGPTEDAWTYKTMDAIKICLCQTWLFRDGAPPGLMERLTSSVLRTLYSATTTSDTNVSKTSNGQLSFQRILCWKSAFKISLAKKYVDVDGNLSETYVDIWIKLEDQESTSCVAAESTGVGLKRLVISAKGQEANGTRNIWEGGYAIVLEETDRVIREYRGLDFGREPACPTCLDTRDVRRASVWSWSQIRDSVRRNRRDMCCENGHEVDIRYLVGKVRHEDVIYKEQPSFNHFVPYFDICPGVVLLGLWDGGKIVRSGSGFIVDSKCGLVVTAAHNAINMAGAIEPPKTFKRNQSRYYGLEKGRLLVGVVTTDKIKKENPNSPVGPEASWRYFAEIASEDICNMDAVVLRITGRLQVDVDDSTEICAQPVDALQREQDFENEGLHQLSVTTNCELEEQCRLIGFSQGGDGIVPAGFSINRSIEVVQGYVAGKRRPPDLHSDYRMMGHSPRYLIVLNTSLTIPGQSGSPVVNQAGAVIGILSRADPADKQRCYLVPTREFMQLVSDARSWEA